MTVHTEGRGLNVSAPGMLTAGQTNRYEGEFRQGRMQGHGSFVYVDGRRYGAFPMQHVSSD
jgi:hypothetical protein